MKIAYVYYFAKSVPLGVEAKIRGQGRAIIAMKPNNLDLFVLNPSIDEARDGVRFVKYRDWPSPIKYIRHICRRYTLIEQALPLERYDYIILRYPLADRTGIAFTSKFRVITEHHALEPVEMTARMQTAVSLAERTARWALLVQEKKYAPQILQSCQGIITVSSHIADFQTARGQYHIPTKVIGNGADIASIQHTGFREFDGKRLDMVFVASNLRPWHGLERITQSLQAYQGPVDMTLHIVGDIHPEEITIADQQKVVFYGVKTGDELDEIMSRMHLAFSTMALYEKGLDEISSLKTPDYIARGIPFILANKDPDLLAVDIDHRFFLEFENDGSLLDMIRIISFAEAMSQKRDEVMRYMRSYALTHLDWQIKLKQYLDFVAEIDGRSRS